MITHFDHAVIAVRDLDAATTLWRDRLGFDARPGGRHGGRGTQNSIVRFGLDYIELISIYDRDEIDTRAEGNAKTLARLLERSEGGLLGYALGTDAIEDEAERLRRAGFDGCEPFPMERLRPDGRLLQWRLLVPGGATWGTPWPFFIQWEIPDEERLRWEAPGEHPNGATAIAALAITVRDLERGRELLGHHLGLRPAGEQTVAELGARRASFTVGSARLDLLSPAGPGPIARQIDAGIEQPWQLAIAVRDLDAARRLLSDRGVALLPAPGAPNGLLIPPEQAMGARLVLVPAER